MVCHFQNVRYLNALDFYSLHLLYSLTKGVIGSNSTHPYIDEVKRQIIMNDSHLNISTVLHGRFILINTNVISRIEMYVHMTGHPGATTKVLLRDIYKFNRTLSNFAFVLILCGTNDLVCTHSKSFDANAIAENIMGIHKYVHSFSTPEKPVYTIAATIPGFYVLFSYCFIIINHCLSAN